MRFLLWTLSFFAAIGCVLANPNPHISVSAPGAPVLFEVVTSEARIYRRNVSGCGFTFTLKVDMSVSDVAKDTVNMAVTLHRLAVPSDINHVVNETFFDVVAVGVDGQGTKASLCSETLEATISQSPSLTPLPSMEWVPAIRADVSSCKLRAMLGGKYSLHVRLTHHNRTAALGLEHDVGYPIFDCVMSPTSTSKESAAYTNVDVNQMLKESSASAPESSAWDPFAPTRGMHPRWSRHQPATSSAAATATAGTPPQPGQWPALFDHSWEPGPMLTSCRYMRCGSSRTAVYFPTSRSCCRNYIALFTLFPRKFTR